MRKIIFILPLLLLLDSCAISRISSNNSLMLNSGGSIVAGRLSGGNLTQNRFFIERADIEINSQGDVQNVIATVKYEPNGLYLISIRTRTGIEAARIFITKDSVLVNDRINRILYYGSTNILSSKYGIEYSLLPVIFGDVILRDDAVFDNTECEGGQRSFSIDLKGKKVMYSFDCKTWILSETELESDNSGSDILLIYKSFVKYNSGIHPSQVSVEYPWKQLKIKIKIRKIDLNFQGKIEFKPGAKYERRELL